MSCFGVHNNFAAQGAVRTSFWPHDWEVHNSQTNVTARYTCPAWQRATNIFIAIVVGVPTLGIGGIATYFVLGSLFRSWCLRNGVGTLLPQRHYVPVAAYHNQPTHVIHTVPQSFVTGPSVIVPQPPFHHHPVSVPVTPSGHVIVNGAHQQRTTTPLVSPSGHAIVNGAHQQWPTAPPSHHHTASVPVTPSGHAIVNGAHTPFAAPSPWSQGPFAPVGQDNFSSRHAAPPPFHNAPSHQ